MRPSMQWGEKPRESVTVIPCKKGKSDTWKCVQAASTFFFLWFAAVSMPEKPDRIKVKYGLVEQ